MPDTTPEQILARAQAPADERPARPQGRDRARRARHLRRVVAARAALAPQAAPVRPRRAGRLVALGALPRLLRRPAAGRATRSTCATTSGRRPPTRRRSRSTPTPRTSSRRSSGSAPGVVVVGHGMGGLLALKAAERMPISGLVLLSSELPRELRDAGPGARAARDPGGLRQGAHRLGDAPRAPAA